MFRFVKQAFIGLLVNDPLKLNNPIKASLNKDSCLGRPTLIDLNTNEVLYYPFAVSLDRCHEICNTLDDSLGRICVSNKTEGVNLNVFNMVTKINESKRFINFM